MLILIFVISITICNAYLEFSSSSSKVTVSDISKINAIGSNSFSISLFFQIKQGVSSVARALLSTREVVEYKAFMVAFYGNWDVYTGYRPFIQLKYNYISYSANEAYSDGNWHHLVITRYSNENDNTCQLNYYINATNIYSIEWDSLVGSGGCSTTIASNGELLIGNDIGTSGWLGNLAHISFWKKSLDINEIQKIYDNVELNQSFISFTDLLHYYPLSESSSECEMNGVIYDVWNNHNGILSSSTGVKCVNDQFTSDHIQTIPDMSKDESIWIILAVAAIIGGILLIAIVFYFYYKSKHSTSNVQMEEQFEIEIPSKKKTEIHTNTTCTNIPNTGEYVYANVPPSAPVDDSIEKITEINIKNYTNDDNIAPSAPIDKFNCDINEPGKTTNDDDDDSQMGNTCTVNIDAEGYDGQYSQSCDIKQWFDDDVELQDLNENDKQLYSNLLIENGFDKMSIIQKMSNNDMVEIGITKLGHRKVILSAVARI